MSNFQRVRAACDALDVGRGLAVWPSSFPPFVMELGERAYPNRRIAASNDPTAILAAARLWRVVYEDA